MGFESAKRRKYDRYRTQSIDISPENDAEHVICACGQFIDSKATQPCTKSRKCAVVTHPWWLLTRELWLTNKSEKKSFYINLIGVTHTQVSGTRHWYHELVQVSWACVMLSCAFLGTRNLYQIIKPVSPLCKFLVPETCKFLVLHVSATRNEHVTSIRESLQTEGYAKH